MSQNQDNREHLIRLLDGLTPVEIDTLIVDAQMLYLKRYSPAPILQGVNYSEIGGVNEHR